MIIGQYELNKIHNVNAYDAIKNIPDKSVDLIYTDPPYLYKRSKNVKSNSDNKISKGKNIQIAELSEIIDGINYDILNDFCRIMKKINIYIWCIKAQILSLMKYFVEEKGCNFELLTWCKTNVIPAINNTFLGVLEYLLYFREKGVPLHGSYENRSKYYISKTNVYDKSLFKHPTIKPLEFVKNHIIISSNEGDIVLDPFMGSGTTAVACKELKRNFIGFEINEEYCKIANNRVNGITAYGQTSIFTDFENLE